MRNKTQLVNVMLTSMLVLGLLAGCATSVPTRFYTLSSPVQNQQAVVKSTSIAIEVLPVIVPERFKRPQLVINTQSAQLKVLEQDRWTASLNDELHDAFASGIANQVGALEISHGGRVPNQVVYRIAITLRQLDAVPGDKIQADFGWTITRLTSGTTDQDHAISCQLLVTKPVNNSIDAMVQGMQAAVLDVVAAISTNINNLNMNETVNCGS